MDADRTRVKFEFEDLAGGATGGPVFGSGVVEGDSYQTDAAVAWYRDQGGAFYQRLQGGNLAPFATTGYETIAALRESILGSVFVTNGTTQQIRATVAAVWKASILRPHCKHRSDTHSTSTGPPCTWKVRPIFST